MVDYKIDTVYHKQPNYAIYLRKSRADIEAEKVEQYDTLSRHYSILMDLAVKGNYNVTDIYREIVSGDTIKARPEMQKLLNAVKEGKYAGVLVTEISRLGRGNSADQGIISETFQHSGTKIITPRKIYDTLQDSDQDFFDFELFMARQEYKYIKRRLVAGRTQSARSGQYIASFAPYGFDKVTIDKKKTLVPNENIKYVKMLFQYFNEGHGYGECFKYMHSIGAVPMRSSSWNRHSVYYILNNYAYIGRHLWKGELIDGIWDAVISEEDFYKRKGKSVPRTKAKAVTRNKYAGLLFCEKCGKVLTLNNGWYYHKNARFPRCYMPSITTRKLDEAVIHALKNAVADFDIHNKKISEEVIDYEPIVADLNRQLTAIYDRYEKGIYDDAEFMDRRKKLKEQLATIDKQKQEQQNKKTDFTDISISIHTLLNFIGNPSVPPNKTNMFLKGFVKKIVYNREDGNSEPSIKIEFM